MKFWTKVNGYSAYYGGYYAANVRLRIQRANETESAESRAVSLEQGTGIKVSWAKLISKLFGDLLTECPKCGEEMQLTGFIFETGLLLRQVRRISRAPRKKTIEKRRAFIQPSIVPDESRPLEQEFDQSVKIQEMDFDQSVSW